MNVRDSLLFIDSVVHDGLYRTAPETSVDKHWQDDPSRTLPTLLRIGERATHIAINKYKYIGRDFIEASYCANGYEVLGAGFRTTVYCQPGEPYVHKVHRGSAFMHDDEREELLESYRGRQACVEYYLGEYAARQTFFVAPHPIFSDRSSVIGEQPRIDFRPLRAIDLQESQRTRDDVTKFLERSEQLALDTGYLIDIKGTNNLIIDTATNRPLLIDTIPSDPQVFAEKSLAKSQKNSANCTRILPRTYTQTNHTMRYTSQAVRGVAAAELLEAC